MTDTLDKTKRPTTIHLNIEIDMCCTLTEFWPDGDGPENPTLDDVLKVIASERGPSKMLEDWGMLNDVTMDVSLDSERPGNATVDYFGKEIWRSTP